MSETHQFHCDHCYLTDEVFCDGRGPTKPPAGWEQTDTEDLCPDCAAAASS